MKACVIDRLMDRLLYVLFFGSLDNTPMCVYVCCASSVGVVYIVRTRSVLNWVGQSHRHAPTPAKAVPTRYLVNKNFDVAVAVRRQTLSFVRLSDCVCKGYIIPVR